MAPGLGAYSSPQRGETQRDTEVLCSALPPVAVVPLAPQAPGHPPEANLEFPGQEEEPPSSLEGGRLGISGHSSAQWPSRFSKGPLGWTLGPPETQVGAPDPAAQNPMGAPALFWKLPLPHCPSALLFPVKSILYSKVLH